MNANHQILFTVLRKSLVIALLTLACVYQASAEIKIAPDFPVNSSEQAMKGDSVEKLLALYRSDVLKTEKASSTKQAVCPVALVSTEKQ